MHTVLSIVYACCPHAMLSIHAVDMGGAPYCGLVRMLAQAATLCSHCTFCTRGG